MDETQVGAEGGEEASSSERFGRRDALKKAAVGAGVAGVVWSAPKIANLSVAPDYAAAATGKCSGTFHVDVPLPGDSDSSDQDLKSDFTTNKTCGPLNFHIDSTYDGTTRKVTITKNGQQSSGNNCNIALGNTNRTYDGIRVSEGPDRQPNHTDANDSDIARAFFDSGNDEKVGQGGTAHLNITC